MSVYAVTGMLCSGKTTVLEGLKERGAHVYNVDEAIHRYYRDKSSKVYKTIAEEFPHILAKDKSIVRKKLRDIVFRDVQKLRHIEEIVHPLAIRDLKKWVTQAKNKKGVYAAEVPLLFEKKLEHLFDKVIFVYVPKNILIGRIRKKFSLSCKDVQRRLSLYSPLRAKIKKSDFVVDNTFHKRDFEKEIIRLWGKLREAEVSAHQAEYPEKV